MLDIFVRRGGQPAELESQVGMLRKIADTLGVLGLGELRQLVIEETNRLEAMAAGKTAADHAALVHIAATLINVEDRLDRDLIGLIVPKAQAQPRKMQAPSTSTSSRCRPRCCASAASTWCASRKPSPRTSPARSMWARSIPGRASSPASRPAC